MTTQEAEGAVALATEPAPVDLKKQLMERTKAFAVRVIRLVERMPRRRSADVIGRQLLRCATSVAANYRAACRARSRKEFVSKLGIVEEEADEAVFWIQLIAETGIIKPLLLEPLEKEAEQILAIMVASIRTARGRIVTGTESTPNS